MQYTYKGGVAPESPGLNVVARRKAPLTARGAQRRRVDTVARDEQRGELEPAYDELVDIEPAEL